MNARVLPTQRDMHYNKKIPLLRCLSYFYIELNLILNKSYKYYYNYDVITAIGSLLR